MVDTVASGATTSAVASIAGNEASAGAADSIGTASGPAPAMERSNNTRVAKELDEDDQAAHKFIRLDDTQEIAILRGIERISVVGEVTEVSVAVPMEKNVLDYKYINQADYQDLVDEDTGEPRDAQKVAEGLNREMKFLNEQTLGEIVDRNAAKSTVWTARWVHRVKGEGVRARYVARQFKNATDEVESDVYAATPRLETIRLLIAWALVNGHEIRTGDFSVAFMFTPVPEESARMSISTWKLHQKQVYAVTSVGGYARP
eukprot:2972312-Amphidinium_carterae.1